MSVSSTGGASVSGAIQSFSTKTFGADKPLFSPIFGVVEAAQERLAAKLDANQDGGVDLQELSALGGLGSGKNGPATFAALDSNGDQKLNLGELRGSRIFSPEVLNTLLGQQTGNGLSEWLVTEGDTDSDSALTLDEFRTVGPTGLFGRSQPTGDAPPPAIDWSERAFTAADSDADGKVTATELADVSKNFIRRLWPGHNASALASDLMTRDLDGSGGLSKAELARDDADAILETADADKDGEITLAELQTEIARLPDFYTRGITKITGPALTPIDPSDPHSRLTLPPGHAEALRAQLPSDGQDGLLRLFREEMLRLTQAMVDEAADPA